MKTIEKFAEEEVKAVERFAEKEVKAVEYELEKDIVSFGKGFTILQQVQHPSSSPETSFPAHFVPRM